MDWQTKEREAEVEESAVVDGVELYLRRTGGGRWWWQASTIATPCARLSDFVPTRDEARGEALRAVPAVHACRAVMVRP